MAFKSLIPGTSPSEAQGLHARHKSLIPSKSPSTNDFIYYSPPWIEKKSHIGGTPASRAEASRAWTIFLKFTGFCGVSLEENVE